jgi:transcriptional regulator with XRE-family HTH domain
MATIASIKRQSLSSPVIAKLATMAGKQPKSSDLKSLMAARFRAARMAYSEDAVSVAEKLGITKQVMSKYENGTTFLDELVIVKFAQLTGCPPDWIFLGRITSEMPATMAVRIGVLAPELVSEVSASAVQAEAGRRSPAKQSV